MDLGFPTQWGPKDTVTLAFGVLSFAGTAAALWLDNEGDKRKAVVTLPEPALIYDTTSNRQYKLAELRAERRATYERGQLYQRVSRALFVLSVVCGFVASEPWLALFGGAFVIGSGVYGVKEFIGEPQSRKTRLYILSLYREGHQYSTSTDYMFDETIFANIETVFSTPESELGALEREVQAAVIAQRAKHSAWLAERKRQQGL